MSIPTRLILTYIDGTEAIVSWFTISYGRDLSDRNVWKDRLSECIDQLRNDSTIKRFAERDRFDQIAEIAIKGYPHRFNIEEFSS